MGVRAAQLKAGDRLGRYRIERLLGSGTSGVVFRAHDTELDVQVALKVIEEDSLQSPRSLERFRRELVLARRLTHPGVCRVFDFFREDNLRIISMEYVEGPTLAAELDRRAPLEVERSAKIARDLCRAVRAAHRLEILHRDLKPHNIVLRPDGKPIILDFGMATALDRSRVTRPGSAIGTPNYMAPEVCRGKPATKGSDVYSLGVILYRCLTGRLPYTGDSPRSMRRAHDAGPPPRPIEVNASVPRSLSDVVMHAIEVDPQLRMPTADVLERRLTDAVGLPDGRVLGEESVDADVDATVVRDMSGSQEGDDETTRREVLPPGLLAGSNEWSAETDEGTDILAPSVASPRIGEQTDRAAALDEVTEISVTAPGEPAPPSGRPTVPTGTVSFEETDPPTRRARHGRTLMIVVVGVLTAGGIVAARRWLPNQWRSVFGTSSPNGVSTAAAPEKPSTVDSQPSPARTTDEAAQQHMAAARLVQNQKALLASDIPDFERTQRAIEDHLAARRFDEAEKAARDLLRKVEGITIDRAFIEGKLRRLNRRYDALPPRRKRAVDPVLNDAMQLFASGELPRVNRRLNDAFALIATQAR